MHVTPRSRVAAAAGLLILTTLMIGPVAAEEAPPGSEQTPIDIRDEDLTLVRRLPTVTTDYEIGPLEVINTGSPDEEATVRAIVPEGSTITIGSEVYDFVQFHWHTKSEHLRNGRHYPMEMHLLNAQDDGDLAVIAVFIRRGKKHNDLLGKIFDDLPQESGDTRSVPRFDLSRLLPRSGVSFRYAGSLTTTPYTEGVRWIVMNEPLTMSRNQIQAFRALFPEGDSRDTQDLNGRWIFSDIRFDRS
jgi:carbonic anhydrase